MSTWVNKQKFKPKLNDLEKLLYYNRDCEFCEIAEYIQSNCYDINGNDSICNFCGILEKRLIKE